MTSRSAFKGRISKVALAAAFLCSSQCMVYALPVGGVVTSGVANIGTKASVTSIQQSTQNAAINWQSFNLSAGESVRVIQPKTTSVLLNRVLGTEPSQIFGNISANGQLFLLNPNGILFAPGSSVNTSGLVATTLNLSDADLNAGRNQFLGNSLASVVNQGSLNAEGGYVTLLGAKVENQGLIQANGGMILLQAQSPNHLVQSVINNTGVLQAQAIENRNGSISLVALGPNSSVNAGGTLDASGLNLGQSGGQVVLLGQQVGLLDAHLSTSGDVGGGRVLIGVDSLANNPGTSLARAVFMSSASMIEANAISKGDGGVVIIKANEVNRSHGQISVRGGSEAGNGGFIETSASQLNVSGLRVDTRAPQGQMGNWVLDPADVTISGAATSNEGFSANQYAPVTGASISNINVGELVVALNAANVTVTSENSSVSGAGHGDINVDAVLTWTGATTLRLNASRDVIVNQAVTGTNGSLLVNAGRDIKVLAAVTTTTGNLEFVAAQDVLLSAATTVTTGHINAVAGRDVNLSAASTITGGSMLLRADNDGTGPGVAGGTVNISCGLNCITLTNGVLSIRFNPVSDANLAAELSAYDLNLTGAAHTLDAKAWSFAKGVDKVYDANTAATLSLAGSVSGSSLVPGTANFASPEVANHQSIAFSGYTLIGAGPNYLLWSPSGVATGSGTTFANITALPIEDVVTKLVITPTDVNKIFGQTSVLTGFTVVGLLNGDTINSVTETSLGSLATASVAGGPYVIVGSGAAGSFVPGHYSISYVNGTLTVLPAALSVTAANASKVFGQTASLPVTGFTSAGLVNGDTIARVVNTSQGSVGTASVAGGPYAIVPSSAEGSFIPTNYTIAYVNGALTVIPLPVVVPPVVVPPVVVPPEVVPPVVAPPEVVPPVVDLPGVEIPTLDSQVIVNPAVQSPVFFRPVTPSITTLVLKKPTEMDTLQSTPVIDPMKPSVKIAPTEPALLPTPIVVTPVTVDRPLPLQPAPIRPRKQDRN